MTGPKLAHVFAVRIHDHWSASFIESTEVAFSAESALEAVSRLLDGFDLAVDPNYAVAELPDAHGRS